MIRYQALFIGFLLASSIPGARACTIVWIEAQARDSSDAVVWGTYVADVKDGTGKIQVARREKGPKAETLPVSWDINWRDDGANCPAWQPNPLYPRGRFFLRKAADGTFTVDAQTPLKRAKR